MPAIFSNSPVSYQGQPHPLVTSLLYTSLILLSLFGTWPIHAADMGTKNFVIVVSKDLKPYLECEQGVREFLENWYKGPHKIISMHLAEKNQHQIKELIAHLKPDMVVCIGTRSTYLLKEIKPNCPWVATFIIDKTIEKLKAQGIVAVSMDVPIENRISVLCKIKDHIHAAILARNTPLSPKNYVKYGPCQTKEAYFRIFPFFSSIEIALQNILKSSINALFITADPDVFSSQEVVSYTLLWGLRNKIAICGLSSGYVRNGALYALEADLRSLGKQTAKLAIDYLLGNITGNVVVQHPERLILSINLRTASRLGLEIPESILKEAQVIIK